MKNSRTTENYLKKNLKKQHRTSDIYLKQIEYQLGIESYLRSLSLLFSMMEIMKHMERLEKLMRLAEHLNWIEKNPTLSCIINKKHPKIDGTEKLLPVYYKQKANQT
ncbi:hypothetical protein RM539_18970 [Zunongwangia sp. F117]|uniref:Phage integrase SAM-like domain-containing protein n=2 Tax=Autumnicola musiva TaxID=3075589 RepID=A0ABU3DBB7_9FLAO|nr:hypothetical protein [Zunongwangia sp. F117]MDT0678664.1 hypothetical protein [Zunongwangia sp. F117]